MTAHTRAFLEHLAASGRTVRDVASEAGLHENTIYEWRRSRLCDASVSNLEAALNVLGYRLAIVPLEGGK